MRRIIRNAIQYNNCEDISNSDIDMTTFNANAEIVLWTEDAIT